MRNTVLILLCLLLSFGAAAQTPDNSRKEKLEREIEILDSQLKKTNARRESALTSLNLTRKQISKRKSLVAESDRQIRAFNDAIYAKQREINRLNSRLDTLSIYYSKLIKNAYKNRDARIWYMYILAGDDLGQGFRRYAYLKNLSSQMNAQAEKIKKTKEELDAEKRRLQSLKAEASKLKTKRQAEVDKLRKEELNSTRLVNQLKKERSKYQKQLASKRKQMEDLNRQVGKIISSSAGKKSRPVDVKLAAQFEANKGKLPWPAEGVIVDSFGQHYHPVFTKVKLPFNNGIGIATAAGATVKAVFDGEVKQVIVMPGYNKCILVQHGTYFTFYCKLASVSVRAGDSVKTGQSIGKVDTIGGETQLHFQLWNGKAPQDPAKWLY